MTTSLPPIPWHHDLSDLQAVWLWETEAFIVKVLGDVHSCYYTVTDKLADPAKPELIADGQTASFHQAEMRVRELIGKAYNPNLGFRKYAGNLATTFTISTGNRIDFGPYEGQMVTVEVFTGNSSTRALTGELRIENFLVSLIKGETHVNIRPTHVKTITLLNNARQEKLTRYERISGRTYRANWEEGCTGEDGFLMNTVEHRYAVCPIHEQ